MQLWPRHRVPRRCAHVTTRPAERPRWPVIWEPAHVLSVRCASMASMRPRAASDLVLGEEELLVERAVDEIVAEVRAMDPDRRAAPVSGPAELTPVDLADEPQPVAVRRGPGDRAAGCPRGRQGPRRGRSSSRPPTRRTASCSSCCTRVAPATRPWPTRCARPAPSSRTCDKITRYDERADFVRAEVRRAGGRIAPGRRRGAASRPSAPTCASWRPPPASWSPTPAARSTSRRSAATTAAGRRRRVSRWPTRWSPVTGSGALEALRWAQLLGVPPVLVADALADAVRTLAKVGSAGPRRPEPAGRRARHAAVEGPQGAVAGAVLAPGGAGRRVRRGGRGQRRRQGRGRRRRATPWNARCCGSARPARPRLTRIRRPSG